MIQFSRNTFAILFILTADLFAQQSHETIKLWPEGNAPIGNDHFEQANATLTIFHPERPNGTAFVITPGGGYGQVVKG
ncbi:MAG: hypothetical protein ACPHOK_06135, partial [Akkermansiaceae bacterium]